MRATHLITGPLLPLILLTSISCLGEIGPAQGQPGASLAGTDTGQAEGETTATPGENRSGALPGSDTPSGAAGSANAPGTTPLASGPSSVAIEQAAADAANAAENPDLFAIAQNYFPTDAPQVAATRLFRLTAPQIDATTALVLPGSMGAPISASLPADPLQHNYEYSEFLGFNGANFTPYAEWAKGLADTAARAPETLIDCAATDEQCLRAKAKTLVELAFRNVPTDEQIDAFVDFFASSVTEVGLPLAVGDLVDVMLTSPHYVFREEVRTSADGALLSPQRLQNLTYTLADTPPESLGLSSASAREYFSTAQDAQDTLELVLASPEARRKLLRFFISWLEIDDVEGFDISEALYPEFTEAVAAAAVDETRSFLREALAGAAPSLKGVTQSSQSFVSDALSFIYDVSAPSDGQMAALDPSQRFGIFTQPSFIASHSGPETTRLIKRGVFFTRKVMCLDLQLPPEGTDTSIADLPNATERERVEDGTNSPTCQACHQFINPFGFMFESYDPIGRFRTTDDQGSPIDPRVSVNFLDEGAFTADTTVAALAEFTHSLRFQQCFARQLFRFYMGRDERPGDDPILRQMFFQFANGDAQDIVGMLTTLSGSSSFSQRSETP